jgi:hypothetical protein
MKKENSKTSNIKSGDNSMKMLVFSTFIVSILILFSFSNAEGVTFYPKPADIGDFDHNYYYAWKISNWAIPEGEDIVEATLTIVNIDDWTNEPNDHLYIHLMDSRPSGGTLVVSGGNVWRWYDNEGGGDNWSSRPLIADYTDPSAGAVTLVYNLSSLGLLDELTTYITDDINHIFYIGFDPDCHYWNKRVIFEVKTHPSAVPEPSTLLLLGAGLIGVGLLRRRFKR